MKKGKYDICIITDGDADRIGAIAPGGRFLPPGWIISLLLLHLVKNRKLTGGVVKTISNSSLIEKIASYYNLKLYETPVGFKYISEIMQKEDVLIGGEESGGIGVKGYIPERDGILSGLLLLEMMAYEGKSLNEIINGVEKKFGRFSYHRIDIRYPDNLKPRLFRKLKASPFKEILGLKVVEFKDYDGMKFILEEGSWILFRLSGTEPILRIYSESSSRKKVQALIEFGHRFAMGIK
jgi:phosphomannomutase